MKASGVRGQALSRIQTASSERYEPLSKRNALLKHVLKPHKKDD